MRKMNQQLRALKPGDRVVFNDPQPEYGPKLLTIKSISLQFDDIPDEDWEEDGEEDWEDGIVFIASDDGSELECYACELEQPAP
jgi:hypothetical protein